MTPDEKLQQDVGEELKWNPRLREADIRILVHERVVTLTGNVPTLAAKFVAEESAKKVSGVKEVKENIEVKLSFSNQRNDADIVQFASVLLSWHVWVPRDVKVTVDNGWVTLTGEVNWNFQKRAVEKALGLLRGVRGISNLITIKPMMSPAEPGAIIKEAFERSAEITSQDIRVQIDKGRVTLSGSVRSLSEREKAEMIAWASPGVFEVRNRISVNSRKACEDFHRNSMGNDSRSGRLGES